MTSSQSHCMTLLLLCTDVVYDKGRVNIATKNVTSLSDHTRSHVISNGSRTSANCDVTSWPCCNKQSFARGSHRWVTWCNWCKPDLRQALSQSRECHVTWPLGAWSRVAPVHLFDHVTVAILWHSSDLLEQGAHLSADMKGFVHWQRCDSFKVVTMLQFHPTFHSIQRQNCNRSKARSWPFPRNR